MPTPGIKRRPGGKPFQKGNKIGPRWQKGQSGNPSGVSKKPLVTAALQKILDDPHAALEYALAAIKHAKRGSAAHFQEINNRVEGSIKQEHAHTGGEGGPIEHTICFGDGRERKPDDER